MAYQTCRSCGSDFPATRLNCSECGRSIVPPRLEQDRLDMTDPRTRAFVAAMAGVIGELPIMVYRSPGRLLAGVSADTVFLWTEGESCDPYYGWYTPPWPLAKMMRSHVTTGGPAYGR